MRAYMCTYTHSKVSHKSPTKANLSIVPLLPPSCSEATVFDNYIPSILPSFLLLFTSICSGKKNAQMIDGRKTLL